ncbi:MAG: hypothetical protein HYY93_12485 [Planctomycetes bacterium]|nr:hypothetical protein [Planctomycetota bacterium]
MDGADDLQRLGQVLIEEGVITHEDVQKVLEQAGALQSPLGELLLGSGFIRREELASLLAQKYTVPRLPLAGVAIHPDMIRIIPPDFARKHEVLPVAKLGDILCVAKSNFFNRAALIELRRMTGSKILVLQSDENEVQEALQTYYPEGVTVTAPPAVAPAPTATPPSEVVPAPEVRPTRPTPIPRAPEPVPAPVAADAPALLNAPKPLPKLPPPAPVPARAPGILTATRVSESEFRAAHLGLTEDPIADFESTFATAKPIPAIPMGTA